jgi:hypothetical protein
LSIQAFFAKQPVVAATYDTKLTYRCTNWYNKPVGNDVAADGTCHVKEGTSGPTPVDFM